ncbi:MULTISPECIES: flagellar basal body rod protein FlgC [unclassified Hahella]|uniref:flagellar basal body rod protein FlgC n=1 Tax=unclassified Hahella TaxID=2624107 RepID=UPI001C1EB262|nr:MULTISPECIES: flagellar basal body rod protein FlgC [unclassified Hahella]MBU6955231.1 flagellar basal body rod protein FlgC [Hahella sp. HN01]WLQ15702.1 flagellar basal body rod protein FlgC [Hahella sp. HNIBRBA332]
MDYLQVFDISGSGLDFQKLRLQAVATNLANVYSTTSKAGASFKPLMAVATAEQTGGALRGVGDMQLVERDVEPRLKYDPAHPHANAEGYVEMPAINPVDEMTSMMLATRAYEANISVMSAAKTMALKALEIGS